MKLDAVRKLALALPEATEAPHFDHTSFRVRGKIFATAPPAGDALHLFLAETAREQALVLHAAFVEKLLWGGKVVGVRVRLDHADAKVVAALLARAWEAKAPKVLLKPAVEPAPAAGPTRPRKPRAPRR
ncbi:MAG: MmcQ/YjbR family DNA-binding protein [Arenimonas sp.]